MTHHARTQPTSVLLCRKPDGWRTTVFEESKGASSGRLCISCGGPETPAEALFEDAAAEFAELLRLPGQLRLEQLR